MERMPLLSSVTDKGSVVGPSRAVMPPGAAMAVSNRTVVTTGTAGTTGTTGTTGTGDVTSAPKKQWEKQKVTDSKVQWKWTLSGAVQSDAAAVQSAALPSLRDRYEQFLYKTEEEYEQRLGAGRRATAAEDWTKEETDYLIELAFSLDLKWPVIADRYRFRPDYNMGGSDQDGDETDETDDNGSSVFRTRSLLELQARFFDVCSSATDQGDLKQAREVFNPSVEEHRRKVLAERYEVSSTSIEREEKLRMLIGCLKTTLEQMELQRKETAKGHHHHSSGGTSVSRLNHDLIMSTELWSEEDLHKSNLSRLERDLLPLKNALSGVYTAHRGPILASQLARQPLEVRLFTAPPSSGATTSGSKQKQTDHSTTVSGTTTGRGTSGSQAGHHHSGDRHHHSTNTSSTSSSSSPKELSEAIDKLLKQVCKAWPSSVSINMNTFSVNNSEVSENIDPKIYFLQMNQMFTPPIPSRTALEAYNSMRLDAAVCCQLQKELETLSNTKDFWIAKLMDIRRSLRNSRRNLAKNIAQQANQQQQFDNTAGNSDGNVQLTNTQKIKSNVNRQR